LHSCSADAYEVACTASFLRDRLRVSGEHYPMQAARHAVTLHRISGRLHRIAEHECNGDPGYDCPKCNGNGWDCKSCGGTGDAPRTRKLRADAELVAGYYRCRAYFQGDPRGCSIYLVPEEAIPAVERLGQYVYDCDGPNPDPTTPEMREKLRARWIDANYTQGRAIVRLGR